MSLVLERRRAGRAAAPERRSRDSGRDRKVGPIVNVALINNMPDAALAATERQFRRLLRLGSEDRIVRLHCVSLPSVRRSPETLRSIEGRYGPVSNLRHMTVDGLIVTGAEPLAASLPDEPFWPALTALADWARDNTVSAIWSCLAAHAAVLHLDGIERRRLPAKCSGVFSCEPRGPHWMLRNIAGPLLVPHSRLNALDEAELSAHGYTVLTSSREVGADIFARRPGRSEFIFFQGHPEYAASALKNEYVRDLRRYLAGEANIRPEPPAHYLDAPTERRLREFVEGVADRRAAALLDGLPSLELRTAALLDSQRAGEALIRNWIDRLFGRERIVHAAPLSRTARVEPGPSGRAAGAGSGSGRPVRRSAPSRTAVLG